MKAESQRNHGRWAKTEQRKLLARKRSNAAKAYRIEMRRKAAEERKRPLQNLGTILDEAFRLESPQDRLPVVIFLTDGLPSVGEQSPERLADRAGRRDYKDKRIIRDILMKAEEVNLPVTKESIKIERGRTRFKIWVTYQKDIEFGFYTYHWNKEHHHDRHLKRDAERQRECEHE